MGANHGLRVGAIGTERAQNKWKNYGLDLSMLPNTIKRTLKRTPLFGAGDTVASRVYGSGAGTDNAAGIK